MKQVSFYKDYTQDTHTYIYIGVYILCVHIYMHMYMYICVDEGVVGYTVHVILPMHLNVLF